MSDEAALERIEREVEQLPLDEQRKLIARLSRRVHESGTGPKEDLDWDELYGIGKDLWDGEDAQEYVNRMREDRECP